MCSLARSTIWGNSALGRARRNLDKEREIEASQQVEVIRAQKAHELVVHRAPENIRHDHQLGVLVIVRGDDPLELLGVIHRRINVCRHVFHGHRIAKNHVERCLDTLGKLAVRGDHNPFVQPVHLLDRSPFPRGQDLSSPALRLLRNIRLLRPRYFFVV